MDIVHEVLANASFSKLLRNVSAHEWRFPKSNVVAIAARYTVALISLSGPVAQDLCEMIDTFLRIAPTPETSPYPQRDYMSRFPLSSTLERDIMSRSAHDDIWTHDIDTSHLHLPLLVLNMTPEALAQNDPDTPPITIYRESGVKGTFIEQTVDKALYIYSPVPSSYELSEPTKVDDAYLDWRESMDRSRISCAKLMRRIMVALEKHVGMYTSTVGTIKKTEDGIDLNPKTKPTHEQPYRAGQKLHEVLEKHMQSQFHAGIIELEQMEVASPVILSDKTDDTVPFSVEFSGQNATTIADTYPVPSMEDCLYSLGTPRSSRHERRCGAIGRCQSRMVIVKR